MTTLIALVTVDEDELYDEYQSAHYLYTGTQNAGEILYRVAEKFVEQHVDDDYFNWYHFRTNIPAAFLAEHGLTRLADNAVGQTVTFDRIVTMLVEDGENIAY